MAEGGCCCCLVTSSVQLFATPWTVAHQPPISMRFPRQEYWSGLPFLLQGSILTPGLNSHLLHWQVDSLLLGHQRSPFCNISSIQFTHSVVSDSLRPHESQHARPPCPSPTHVHRVSDAIQPSHPLLSPSPPAPNSSQHQGLFQ